MNSVELVAMFGPILEAEAQRLVPGIPFRPLNQPTNQPRGESGVFYTFLMDHRHGTPHERRKGATGRYDLDTKTTQVMETIVQFSVLHDADPATTVITAKDITDALAMKLATRPVLSQMKKAGAAILKINDVRNPAFHNDQDQFEFMASFDVTFIHNQVLEATMPKIVAAEGTIVGV